MAAADVAATLTAVGAHAAAAHDGPAKASVLVQEANVLGVPARWTGLPQAKEEELAGHALWVAGASSSTSGLRADARSQLAWERAAVGDEHGALRELDWAVGKLSGRDGVCTRWTSCMAR